jgi:hypothetical protein
VAEVEQPDAILFHVNMPQFLTNPSIPDAVFDNLVDGARKVSSQEEDAVPVLLTLRSDGSAKIDERRREARQRALASGLPVFDEIANALVALSHFQRYERFRHRQLVRRDAAL